MRLLREERGIAEEGYDGDPLEKGKRGWIRGRGGDGEGRRRDHSRILCYVLEYY